MLLPNWLRLLFFIFWPAYRRRWRELERRSHVTGTAREECVIGHFLGYRWTVQRQVRSWRENEMGRD